MFNVYERRNNGDIMWVATFGTIEEAEQFLNSRNNPCPETYKIERERVDSPAGVRSTGNTSFS